jgi:small-conductance mechanosensitive channel
MDDFLKNLDDLDSVQLQVALTAALVVIYFVFANITGRLIKRFGKKNQFSLTRTLYTIKFSRFVFFLILLLFLGLIWDLRFTGLSRYFFTFFTVAGVALFATWSILSNITASVLLFFFFPYKLGSKIRIVDGDNSIEGVIIDLNLFAMIIKDEQGRKVSYPNNVALQKAIISLD